MPPPLHVGDLMMTGAKVASIINTDAGRVVEVVGDIIHEGKPITEVTSSFLHRSRFTDHEDAFEIVHISKSWKV